MLQRKVLVVTAGSNEEIQEKVNKAMGNLGENWFPVSAVSDISTVLYGNVSVGGKVLSHIVTTILMEKTE